MKNLIAILLSLSILLPSSAIGADLSQWKDVDQQMIDIVKSGFEIVSHSHSYNVYNRTESRDIYILKKGRSVYKCYEIHNQYTRDHRIGCQSLVTPFEK